MSNQPVALIIMGPQGSGKTTQTERVAQHFQLPIFESGTELRQLAKQDTPLAHKIRQQMASGQLADNPTLWHLFQLYLAKHPINRGIILDGFPRTIDQCQLLAELAEKYTWRIQGVYLAISDTTAQHRLEHRFSIVDGQKVTREDDRPAIVKKRLALFHQRTEPVLDWLKAHHQLLTIDGEPTVDQVTNQLLAALTPVFNHGH